MKLSRREFGIATAALLLSTKTFAQPAYPGRPVTLLIPQSPGGTNDVVGRILAEQLTHLSGQPFIVENRAGANGNLGTEYAARANGDGYTLLLTVSSTQAINPVLYRKVGFDPVQDFPPVAPVGTVPNVLVVHPSFPAKTMAEFVKVARESNPPIQYGSAGNGSLNHLLGAMLTQRAGIPLQHIPYRGVSQAMTDVMGGQIPMAFASLPSCVEFVRSGKLRALGVSSAQRSPALPDVEAIGEVVPGYEGELWVGLFAIKGTPAPVIQKLSELVEKATSSPDALKKLKSVGVERIQGGPDKLAAMLKADIARWTPIVKESGAIVD